MYVLICVVFIIILFLYCSLKVSSNISRREEYFELINLKKHKM